MRKDTEMLQAELRSELRKLQSAAEVTAKLANHLTGLTLNPDARRQDLVPESTVVKEITALLQHALQNLSHQEAQAPGGRKPRQPPATKRAPR